LPARRLIVRAQLLNEQGTPQSGDERWLGRKLVDATGGEVPFYRATRLAEDTRIAPKGERREHFELRGADAGILLVEVRWRAYAPAIATALGLTEVADELMAEVRVPIGAAPAKGARKGLPARRSVTPAKPGAKKGGR
jgi:hypothetical protein